MGRAAPVSTRCRCVPAHRQRHWLQRHYLPRRSRLGRVRQRQDVGQGECRQVPAERQQPGPLRDQQSGTGHAVPRSTARSWNDLDRDYVPDCESDESGRQRRVWRLADSGFRQPDSFDDQPRNLPRLGRSPLGLAVRRLDSARGAAANLARVRLQPSLVPEFPGHRQPGAWSQRRRPVHDRRAPASRSARRRRLHGHLPRSAHAGGATTTSRSRRTTATVRLLARLRPERQHPADQRPGASGRDQYRARPPRVL